MLALKPPSGYYHSVKWGWYKIGISFVRQLLLLPVFILSVGKEGYALWLILVTIVTLINAISVGHLHYSSNLINLTYHQQDKKAELAQLMGKIFGSGVFLIVLQLVVGAVVSYMPFL